MKGRNANSRPGREIGCSLSHRPGFIYFRRQLPPIPLFVPSSLLSIRLDVTAQKTVFIRHSPPEVPICEKVSL